MSELKRLTTEYVETEDRFRLCGEVGEGAPMVLWLTQRLLQRLLPPLFEGLEKEHAALPRADVVHGFAQQKAQAGLARQAPVRAADAGALVTSIDLSRFDQALRLTFKGADGQAATLTMNATLLRQWLGIVYTGYRRAEWPLERWPDWMDEGAAAPAAAPSGAVLH